MHTNYRGGDPANYPQASVGFDYDAVDESIASKENHGPAAAPPSTAEALIKLIAFIIDGDNYLLRVDIIVAGSGLALCQGWSYTEMAKKHGISKQAFDKHILKFQKDFQLPTTRAQKSPQARESYRKTQLDREARLKEKRQTTKERTELVWRNSLKKEQKVRLAN